MNRPPFKTRARIGKFGCVITNELTLVAVSGSELFYAGASAVSPSANHLLAIDLQISLQLATTWVIPSSMQFLAGL